MEAREICRFLERYAKKYHAGGFATPLAGEITKAGRAGRVHLWRAADGSVATIAVSSTVGRSRRRDFTGSTYALAPGSRAVTSLARVEGAAVPDLSDFDYVFGYREDQALSDGLAAQGRVVRAVRISASSEIIACWARAGEGRRYEAHDEASLTELPWAVSDELRNRAEAELAGVDGWHDDYPFYNRDGSWSALSLRGFKRDDPTWGIKPSEMSKSWRGQHPEASGLTACEWTVLADDCPALVEVVENVGWWRRFERIRLLKLSGRGGQGGQLLRHTDITDRAAGTSDGQICRFHIPLVTHPSVRTVVWDLDGQEQSVNLAPWRLYYLDQRKPHMVVNPSSVERVHLVVDVVADNEVRERIAASA